MTSLDDRLYRETEAAEKLNVRVRTLQQWRIRNRGPKFVKLGRKSIRYSASALLEFINAGQRRAAT